MGTSCSRSAPSGSVDVAEVRAQAIGEVTRQFEAELSQLQRENARLQAVSAASTETVPAANTCDVAVQVTMPWVSHSVGLLLPPAFESTVAAHPADASLVASASASVLAAKPSEAADREPHDRGHDGSTAAAYFGFEELLGSIESGAIGAVRGTFVIALQREGGRIARRQDLPPSAFWTAKELRGLCDDITRHYGPRAPELLGLLFVVLSCALHTVFTRCPSQLSTAQRVDGSCARRSMADWPSPRS